VSFIAGFQPRIRPVATALPWRFAPARYDDFFFQLAGRRFATRRSTKRNRSSDEIGTKHVTCNVVAEFVGSRPMKTFIFLALAFLLTASVAVISITSSPSSAHAEHTSSALY
jgi:hypothetical protein